MLLRRWTWGESNGGPFKREAIHHGPKLMQLHRSHPNTCYARGNSGSLPLPFEMRTVLILAHMGWVNCVKSAPESKQRAVIHKTRKY